MVTAVDDRALNEAGSAIDRKIGARAPERGAYLDFLDAFLGLDSNGYRASDFPSGFFDQVLDRINVETAMGLAIRVWHEEANLIEGTPPAGGILGTAVAEALRTLRALSVARFGKDSE